MNEPTCAVPWPHHSDDLVKVFHGAPAGPTIMCGFHASDLKQSLRKIREAAAAAPSVTTDKDTR